MGVENFALFCYIYTYHKLILRTIMSYMCSIAWLIFIKYYYAAIYIYIYCTLSQLILSWPIGDPVDSNHLPRSLLEATDGLSYRGFMPPSYSLNRFRPSSLFRHAVWFLPCPRCGLSSTYHKETTAFLVCVYTSIDEHQKIQESETLQESSPIPLPTRGNHSPTLIRRWSDTRAFSNSLALYRGFNVPLDSFEPAVPCYGPDYRELIPLHQTHLRILTRIPSGESIWGSRSKKDRLLKNQWR
jgi:hypothetical protein